MKVLMIERFLPTSLYSLELAIELQEYTELTLLCKSNAGEIEKSLLKTACKKCLYGEKLPVPKAQIAYLKDLMSIRSGLKGNYDVVHVQTFKKAEIEIPIYIQGRKKGTVLVHTAHNILPHEAKKSDRDLYARFYDACDVLIAHNENCKNILMEDYSIPENKIKVIAHGINGDMIPNLRRKSDHFNFLMFGMIREYKGADILIQAVAKLPENIRKRCTFTLAGKQFQKLDTTDYVALAEELGVSDCMDFQIRHIEYEELPEIFARTDACIFPYREIYTSGALLMAYTYQKPVITSDVATFVEETDNGGTGLLFKNEDPQNLADAIEKFINLEEEDRQAFNTRIAELVAEKYNWKSSAKKTAEAYMEARKNI